MSAQAQLLLENSSVYVNQLAQVQTQLNILADVEAYLNDENSQRVLPNAVVTDDVVFNDLITSYNEVLLERGRRLISATPNNPTIINLERQLNAMRKNMLDNLRRRKSRLNITKAKLEQKKKKKEKEKKK